MKYHNHILIILGLLLICSTPYALSATPYSNHSRPILDQQNRQLILHGLNNSNAAKNTLLGTGWEKPEDIEHQGKVLAFNAARHLIAWDNIMPTRGNINYDYLSRVEERLQWYANNNMKVVLVMHQDIWGKACGGNGAPDWATVQESRESLPAGSPWWLLGIAHCATESAARFYSNEDNLQEDFAEAWWAVAEKFNTHPAVIGYDLFNEPTRGDAILDLIIHERLPEKYRSILNWAVSINYYSYNVFSEMIKAIIPTILPWVPGSETLPLPDDIIDNIITIILSRPQGDWGSLNALREFEKEALTAFYQKVIHRIREVDQNTYIFVEPMSVGGNIGQEVFLGPLTDPRQAGRRLGFIPHLYPRELHEGQPYDINRDNAILQRWKENHSAFVKKNDMSWLIGEFGISNT